MDQISPERHDLKVQRPLSEREYDKRTEKMEVNIPFGDRFLNVEVPKESLVLEPRYLSPLRDPGVAMVKALQNPIGTLPLFELARNRHTVAIVINHVTQPSPSRLMLETLLQELAKTNLSEKAIKVVVANGYHRMTASSELLQIVGSDLLQRLRIINHESLDEENLVSFGVTERGLPIWINRWVAQAELKILTGIITPHQVAGYSGGRKSIIPGVASFETIRRHHSPPIRPLEPVMRKMRNNSFHVEAVTGAKRVGIDFILNVVKNARGELTVIHHQLLDGGVFHTFGTHSVRSSAGYPLKNAMTASYFPKFAETPCGVFVEKLAPYLVGWRGYFGFCQTPVVLSNLDAWIRRRLRIYLWRQWKNGKTRFRELRRRGVPQLRAAVAAGSPTGFWRMCSHPAVQQALRNNYFDSIGLPRLSVSSTA
jgi:hypothetical protein